MKKEGIIIIAVALLFLAISNIQAVQIINNNPTTGNIIKSQGDDLTGDSISGKATSQQFAMNISILPYSDTITIIEPLNITYDFAANETYLLNLSVSSNFAADTWWFSLYDLNHSDTIYENLTFTPNTNFTARKWENRIAVYANNSTGGIANASVEFYVNLNHTSPVISINSPIFACEKTNLSYFFNITDLNEYMKTADISPRNIFFLSNHTFTPDDYEFNYNVNYTTWAHEIFSVYLNKTHAGGPNSGYANYLRSLLAWDGGEPVQLGVNFDLKSITITVIETNTLPNVTTPGVQTIYSKGENSTFYHELWAEDVEDGNISSGNLTANISFQGLHLFNITPGGIINFTSNTTIASVNNITVCVSDLGLQNPHPNISICNETGLSNYSCVNFSLTITNENRPPNITSYWPLTLEFTTPGQTNNYFNITTYDPDGTIPDVRWYVNNVLVEYDAGSSLSELTYAFPCEVSGLHIVKAVRTDGLLTDEMQWNVTVQEVKCPTPSEGGGGGGPGIRCIQKWACRDWNICESITQKLNKGELSGEEYREAKETCEERGLKEEQCGIQNRFCFDVNECYPEFSEKTEVQTCHYSSNPNCFDGIKNCHQGSCELLIDCGGPCTSCPTCSDGIQNQGEEGIDCGGPCPWSCEEEKPAPPKTNYRYSLLILIILLLLYVMNKTFRIIEKRTIHKSFILSVFLTCLLIFCVVFLYFYSSYNVGDFVYKKDARIIGEVKNTSATLNHIIQWQDGTYSKEFIFSIGKVKELEDDDVENMLETNNKQDFSLYSWSPQGLALSDKVPIKKVEDLKEYTIKIEEDCHPSFICGPWSECKVDYGLQEISGDGMTYGTATRFCRDTTGCMSDFIYSDRCVLEEQVMLYKTITPQENYFEVYDLNSNLVARINKIVDKGIEKLNIEIIG